MTTHKSYLFCEVRVGEGELHCSNHHKFVDYLSCCYVHYFCQLLSATFATGWLAAHRFLLGQLLHASQDFVCTLAFYAL